MFKRTAFLAVALAGIVSLGYADQSKGKITIPVNRTSAVDGKEMYTSYCAPCHGTDGRGNGPVSSALKTQPTDLTTLAKANHGKYPDTHVLAVLRFGLEIPAHGSASMPVWGNILAKMNQSNSVDRDLRISNLTRYLQSMQVK